MSESLEDQIVSIDRALEDTEKLAKAALARIRTMRKRAIRGDLSTLPALLDQVPAVAEQITHAAQGARGAITYDTAAALSDGSYLAELKAAASARGVNLVERDGRLSAFPLLLKLEPRSNGIRIGRKIVRDLRPGVVIDVLAKAQAATSFDAKQCLAQLFKAYRYLAPLAQPGWKPDTPGEGPVVPLLEVYDLLTVLAGTAAEFTQDAFACNLLRLDRAPDTMTVGGHSFRLPASTGSKGAKRLTVFDEAGEERVYVGIRFALGGGGGD